MVDRALVLRKLADLQEYLGQVREYSDVPVAQYTADWKTQRIVERTLQMMIELCSDIAGHIIADANLRVPVSYADTFRVLFEAGLLDARICSVMEKMAKFRNVVVYHYDRVDAAIVVTILRRHLDDFLLFSDATLAMLALVADERGFG